MSGRVIAKSPCPKCVDRGNDTRGDNLVLYDDGGGHCFACGYHKFNNRFIRDIIQSNTELNNGTKSLLPYDFTREVPSHAWKWLLQYGLSFSYWKPHCGYSEKEQRLVFTVGTPLQFSIGRYCPSEVFQSSESGIPLVLQQEMGRVVSSQKPRKWYVWGNCHQHCEIVNEGRSEKIVFVEDLISAHVVGQVTTAIPLFGTRIFPCHVYGATVDHRPLVLWQDKDQEQQVKQKASWLQLITGKPVDVLITDKDPKTYTKEQIEQYIR